MDEKPKTTLTDGSPVTPDHTDLKENGQQVGYVVLSEEERAKGYVRPVRRSYVHVGRPIEGELRDLTPEEQEAYPLDRYGYIKYEVYPSSKSPLHGRFWKQEDLDHLNCRAVTTMAQSIAETYARNPKFYGGTFCIGCGAHLPVDEFVWEGTDERVGS